MSSKKKKLTQAVFIGQPESVNWCGVDYDGLLSFGKVNAPRYAWLRSGWQGFELIGEPQKNTNYVPGSFLNREPADWQQLQHVVTAFADKTFGESSTPVPALYHLLEEVREIIEAAETGAGTEELALEYADAFILLIQSAQRSGFSMQKVFDSCIIKHEINKSRKWGAPDHNGVVKHIKKQ